MTKILTDIDGVLNPFLMPGMPSGYISVQEGWISWRLDLLYHASWLRDLNERAEIIWASTWAEDSNTVNMYFAIPVLFPHIDFTQATTRPGTTGKLADVQQYLAGTDEPVIWLEDELEADAFEWAAQRPNTLLIHCDPRTGLTEAQYHEILAFLAVCAPAETR